MSSDILARCYLIAPGNQSMEGPLVVLRPLSLNPMPLLLNFSEPMK